MMPAPCRLPAAPAETYTDAEARAQALRANAARQVSQAKKRSRIDPTTCERDYTAAELEFMAAMQEYKRSSGRAFPTWSEVLEVVQTLGYRRDTAGEAGR